MDTVPQYHTINSRHTATGSIDLQHESVDDTRLAHIRQGRPSVVVDSYLFDSSTNVFHIVNGERVRKGKLRMNGEQSWSFVDVDQVEQLTKSYPAAAPWTVLELVEMDVAQYLHNKLPQ